MNEKLRDALGTLVIAVVVTVWVYGKIFGDPLGALWEVTMLAIVIAAAYSVFGRRTMNEAIENAKDLSGEESSEEDE